MAQASGDQAKLILYEMTYIVQASPEAGVCQQSKVNIEECRTGRPEPVGDVCSLQLSCSKANVYFLCYVAQFGNSRIKLLEI